MSDLEEDPKRALKQVTRIPRSSSPDPSAIPSSSSTSKKKPRKRRGHGESGLKPRDGAEVYDVERIVGKELRHNIMHYEVKWAGYGPEDNCFVKESDMQCAELIEEFQNREREIRKAKRDDRYVDTVKSHNRGASVGSSSSSAKKTEEQKPSTSVSSSDNGDADEDSGTPDLNISRRKSPVPPIPKVEVFEEFFAPQPEDLPPDSTYLHFKDLIGGQAYTEAFDGPMKERYEKPVEGQQRIFAPKLEEHYRKTQPLKIIGFFEDEVGNPFVHMEWADGIQLYVSCVMAMQYYPFIFYTWADSYMAKNASASDLAELKRSLVNEKDVKLEGQKDQIGRINPKPSDELLANPGTDPSEGVDGEKTVNSSAEIVHSLTTYSPDSVQHGLDAGTEEDVKPDIVTLENAATFPYSVARRQSTVPMVDIKREDTVADPLNETTAPTRNPTTCSASIESEPTEAVSSQSETMDRTTRSVSVEPETMEDSNGQSETVAILTNLSSDQSASLADSLNDLTVQSKSNPKMGRPRKLPKSPEPPRPTARILPRPVVPVQSVALMQSTSNSTSPTSDSDLQIIGVVGAPIRGMKKYDDAMDELKRYLPMLTNAIDKLTKEKKSPEDDETLHRITLLHRVASHTSANFETVTKCVEVIRRSKDFFIKHFGPSVLPLFGQTGVSPSPLPKRSNRPSTTSSLPPTLSPSASSSGTEHPVRQGTTGISTSPGRPPKYTGYNPASVPAPPDSSSIPRAYGNSPTKSPVKSSHVSQTPSLQIGTTPVPTTAAGRFDLQPLSATVPPQKKPDQPSPSLTAVNRSIPLQAVEPGAADQQTCPRLPNSRGDVRPVPPSVSNSPSSGTMLRQLLVDNSLSVSNSPASGTMLRQLLVDESSTVSRTPPGQARTPQARTATTPAINAMSSNPAPSVPGMPRPAIPVRMGFGLPTSTINQLSRPQVYNSTFNTPTARPGYARPVGPRVTDQRNFPRFPQPNEGLRSGSPRSQQYPPTQWAHRPAAGRPQAPTSMPITRAPQHPPLTTPVNRFYAEVVHDMARQYPNFNQLQLRDYIVNQLWGTISPAERQRHVNGYLADMNSTRR